MSDLANPNELDSVVDTAARAVANEERSMTEHPATEALVGYQENRLTKEAARQVRQHLAVCRECARDVLALEGFDLAKEDSDLLPSPSEVGEDWEAFQQKLEKEPPASGRRDTVEKMETLPAKPLGATWEAPHFAVLAASIVLALGLGYLIPGTFPGGGTSHPNPFMTDLVPDGTVPIRDASSVHDVTVPEGMDPLILRLNLGDQTLYDDFRAEILDVAGAIRWRQDGLRRQPAGQFIVSVERARLPEGSYELRLSGIGSGETRILASYSFRLRHAPKE